MRLLFSVLGLLVVAAVVGLLARQSLPPVAPTASSPGTAPAAAAAPQQVEQLRQSLESQLQQARPMPDDAR